MADVSGDGTAALRFQLLGPVRAWRGDAPLEVGSAHRRTVLAVLASSPGSVVSREEIVDAVWGDAPPASASGSIYTYISSLRHALGGKEILESVGSGYSLRVPGASVDVHRFDALRLDAGRALHGGAPATAIGTLDEALALWHGDALAGLSAPFAELARTRLGELRLATTELRAEACLAAGRHAEVIAELGALTREHPLREMPRELLIRALDECGRRTEALAVFDEFRDTLIQASGTEPSPPLCALRDRVIGAGKPVARVPRSAAAHGRPARAAAFAGRADVLRRLRAAATDGPGAALLVQGPAGIGKTALLAEAFADLGGDDLRVGFTAADEVGPRAPLHLISTCLSAAGAAPLTARDDEADEAAVAAVHELCAAGPLLLVADDLHWADEASLRVWRHLIRLTEELPLVLVGACRPLPGQAGLENVRVDLAMRGDLVICLEPLPDEDVRAMVEHILGAPPARELRRYVAAAAGNPFYAKEMVEKLVDEGRVVVDGSEAYAADLGALPAAVVTRITDHLAFLSDDTREALRWAALLGDEFTVPDLAAALDRPVTGLADVVEEALLAGLVVESAEWLSFRHPIVRRVLHHKTPASMRVVLHRQLAERLADGGASAGRVAEQLAAMKVPVDDWTSAWLAGNIAAVAAETPQLAVGLLRDVVGQSTLAADLRETLTATLARLLFWLGREPSAEARLVLARTPDGQCAAEMRWILAFLHYRRGRRREAAEEVRRALADADVCDVWRDLHLRLRDAVADDRPVTSVLDVARLLDVGLPTQDMSPAVARRMAPYRAIPGEIHLAGAVGSYWAGRWQETTEEVRTILHGQPETAPYLLRTPGAVLLVHGLAALIAGHRGEGAHAREFLRAAARQSFPHAGDADTDPEATAFLLAATALHAEQEGSPQTALDALTPILDPGFPAHVRHQWLTRLTRLALNAGDRKRAVLAARAVEAGEDGAAPGEAHAVGAHCQGIITGNPDLVLAAAAYYERADRVLRAAQAWEDAAVPLAGRGRLDEARTAFRRALATYTRIGAGWDVRCAEARMRPYGIRRAGVADSVTDAAPRTAEPARLSG
jgi:DNA-binding SARP family transcriptional activator/tetratricopeptide (TPR) repeat protein